MASLGLRAQGGDSRKLARIARKSIRDLAGRTKDWKNVTRREPEDQKDYERAKRKGEKIEEKTQKNYERF